MNRFGYSALPAAVNSRKELNHADHELVLPWPQAVWEIKDCVASMSSRKGGAIPMHLTRIGCNDSSDCFQQCCLTCPIRSDQAQYFSWTYIEGDIDQCTLLAVMFVQTRNLHQHGRLLCNVRACDDR